MIEKRGRGRPPTGKIVVKVRLSKADLETCLRHGATAQEGISHILGTLTRTQPAETIQEPAEETSHLPPAPVRWVCIAPKCYTHPVNYGDHCSDCRSPRPERPK